MCYTSEKLAQGRYKVSIVSRGVALSTAVSRDRQQAHKVCLERYQRDHGAKLS